VRRGTSLARSWIGGTVLGALTASGARADVAASSVAAALDRAVAAAETSLREGEPQTAESHYRSALLEGWLVMGTLERLDGRLAEAREAFRRAAASVVENRPALQALALTHLQMGEAAEAERILVPLVRTHPDDVPSRRLLAQALAAGGKTERAVQELEAARAAAPRDLELAFGLGGQYLALKKPERAAPLFAQIVEARPIPQTHVLIGRAYRDHGEYERARAELRIALKQDPRVRHAHTYLGQVLVAEKGMAGLEDAIAEFRAEIALAPDDPLANLGLGMALVDTQRPEEALRPLAIAARAEPADARTLYYFGRSQLGSKRSADAVASFQRALALTEKDAASADRLRAIHNQMGQALRGVGRTEEAAAHFAESQRLSAQGTDTAREEMTRYAEDSGGPRAASVPVLPLIEAPALAQLTPSDRAEIERRVKAALARTYLNLGVMQVQGDRFARGAELFEKAAEIDADFPRVQSSLGVAYFNAGQFDKAIEPLRRALAAEPGDAGLKRMVAMAWLDMKAYDKAAQLLKDDPELGTNPSLQFAYGMALVKSDRAAEAERIFSGLLARHGDSAELSVLMGQAYAQQGDFESAIAALERALALQADVPEANATLGVIYLRQGRLAEAEKALTAEVKAQPSDLLSKQNLAVVLDSEQRPDEAIPLLRAILAARPESATPRYLLGKILLAQGGAAEAAEHLEAAARLSPGDANIHYQLGQAYQRLGRTELAQQQFEVFRDLKAKR
jgi:tetratricopeptide (TPR) repeat protein